MVTNSQRRSQDQLVIGTILVVLAVSIIIVIIGNLSIWYLPTMLILLIGFGFIFINLSGVEKEPLEYTFGPTQSRYRFAWGVMFSILGVLGLLYLSVPGLGWVFLFAILILCVGLILLFYRVRGVK